MQFAWERTRSSHGKPLVQPEFVPSGVFFFLMNLSPHLGLLGVDLRIFFSPVVCCVVCFETRSHVSQTGLEL